MMKKPRRAFTLVEILVVLAIITLLAALLFAVFGRVRENGRAATCLSNQKQILLALQLYQEDAEGIFPLNLTSSWVVRPQIWIDSLLVYTKTPQIFVCPSDTDLEATRNHGFEIASDGSQHPSIPASYIANDDLMGDGDNAPRSLAEIKNPAALVFVCDGVLQASPNSPYWTSKMENHDNANDLAALGFIMRDPHAADTNPSFSNGFAPNPRHNRRVNVGFVDGHVKSMDLSKWYFPKTPYLDPARGG